MRRSGRGQRRGLLVGALSVLMASRGHRGSPGSLGVLDVVRSVGHLPRPPWPSHCRGRRASLGKVASSVPPSPCHSTTRSPTARRSTSPSSASERPTPAHRIGSLVLNPGGPGGSGVDFVRFAGPFLFTDQVRARFDLVGFDPRGINRSHQLRCFQDSSEWAPLFTPFAFPLTPTEERQWKAADLYPRQCLRDAWRRRSSTTWRQRTRPGTWTSCAKRSATTSSPTPATPTAPTSASPTPTSSPITSAPSSWTASSTRSNGRPARPTTSELPFSTRLRSDAGAQATLKEFFRLCDEAGPLGLCLRASFGQTVCRPRRQVAEGRLDHDHRSERAAVPLQLLVPHRRHPRRDVRLSGLAGLRQASWPSSRATSIPPASGAALAALHRTLGLDDPMFNRYTNNVEGFPGVACSDTDNPHSYDRVVQGG